MAGGAHNQAVVLVCYPNGAFEPGLVIGREQLAFQLLKDIFP